MEPGMTEPRVLVVDDEEGPREAIRMILKPRYQVFTAASGEEVLAVLPGLRPDVIFMDVKMPRMDGVQLLERVKAIDAGVEVVMITAYASLDTVQRAMRFGAMDYLVKPFAPRELQEAAERALARRRQRTEGPGGALAPLIGKMRDLAQRRDPVQGGDLAALLRAMLHEAQRVTGAAAASFLGTEPAAIVHSDLPAAAGDAVAAAWRTALQGVQEPVGVRPGLAWPLPWPAELDALGFEAAMVVPAVDEGLPRVRAHLALYHRRAPAPGGQDLARPPARDGSDGHGRAHLRAPDGRGPPGRRTVAESRPGRDPQANLDGRARRPRPRPDARCDHRSPPAGRGVRARPGPPRPGRAGGERGRPDGPSSPWSRRGGTSARSSSKPAASSTRASGICSGCSRSRSPSSSGTRTCTASSRRPNPSWRTSSSRRPSPSWRSTRRAGSSRGTPRPSACSAAEPTKRAASSSATRCRRP